LGGNCNFRLDLLGGARYLRLNEDLAVGGTFSAPLANPFMRALLTDSVRAESQFWGGQIGLRGQFQTERWFFAEVTGKVAFGATEGFTQVTGSSTILPIPGLFFNGPEAAFATTHQSTRTCNLFAVVPEVGVNFGVKLTDCIRLTLGYTFTYWSAVARAPD